MTFRNIFPFKNERGPLWLDLLCKSKTILHKSKLKFTWTFRKRERKEKIVDHVFFNSDNSLKNILLFFFFYFWGLFKRYLYLFTMPYSNEHQLINISFDLILNTNFFFQLKKTFAMRMNIQMENKLKWTPTFWRIINDLEMMFNPTELLRIFFVHYIIIFTINCFDVQRFFKITE